MGLPGSRPVATIAVVAAAALTATACGSDSERVRDHVSENYELVSDEGTYKQYACDESADQVADDIADTATPGREHDEGTGHYLGYKDVMVHVDDSSGDCRVEVTDPRDGYNRWGTAIVPIWGTFGGSYRSAFSGGGIGGGK